MSHSFLHRGDGSLPSEPPNPHAKTVLLCHWTLSRCLGVWSRNEVVRIDLTRAEGLDFQASQMLWKGVFHLSALRCLAKLYVVTKLST